MSEWYKKKCLISGARERNYVHLVRLWAKKVKKYATNYVDDIINTICCSVSSFILVEKFKQKLLLKAFKERLLIHVRRMDKENLNYSFRNFQLSIGVLVW